MSTICTRVSRVAGWTGWCSPCEREDRPLVLTRSGPGGLRAWLTGLGDDDRLLLLTCRVCGSWQFVPAREEDDPEVVLTQDEDVVEALAPVAPPVLPLPRAELPAAPVEPPAPVVPAPRVAAPRIITVPDASPVLAVVSPQAVAAAAQVLAAARAQTQRTASTVDRTAPLDRTRRSRSGPATHRATRPTPAREVHAHAVLQLPPSIALPAGTSQVVLAPAG